MPTFNKGLFGVLLKKKSFRFVKIHTKSKFTLKQNLFVVTGVVHKLVDLCGKLSFGIEILVLYNRMLVITEFIITKFIMNEFYCM